jgi:photosystem II stability/assembly factor-like uncharacterized protein
MMNNKPFLRHFAVVVSLLGFLFATSTASAQWQRVFGPTGGDVEALASDAAGHLYAGTDSGVYVSTNNGTDWVQKNAGLLDSEIFSFAVTPSGTVLAGTEGSGIFRSTNFGDTWEAANEGLPPGSNILSLVSDRAGNIFAGHSMSGVYFSSDDGLHWTARNTGMETQTIFSLTVTPSGTIYAGAIPYIFSSNDLGQHWDTSYASPGPITGTAADEVLALAADSSGNVFAGTFHAHRARLLSGNSNWDDITPVAINSDLEVRTLATGGGSVFAGLLGAGVILSGNLGTSWSDFSSGLTDPKIFSMTFAPSGYLFVGTFLAEIFRINPLLAVHDPSDFQESFEVWPQPFHDKVNVSFSLDKTEFGQIEIFDALGRKVRASTGGILQPGRHDMTLDLSTLPSGAYLFILRTPTELREIRSACLR